jgi:N6-L-threonylcarbamoyladenine synthase
MQVLEACEHDGLRCLLPSPAMCTDNAAMIAATAWHRLRSDGPTPLDAGAVPSLRLPLAL